MREVAKRVLEPHSEAKRSMGALRLELPEDVWRAHEEAMRPLFALARAYLEAEKVIAYYADPENWLSYNDVDETWPAEIPKEDRGKKARAFLAEQEAKT